MADNRALAANTEGRFWGAGAMTSQGRWSRRALLRMLGAGIATAGAGPLLPKGARAGSAPSRQAWAALEQQLQGRLLTPQLPWSNASAGVLQKLRNPFWIQDQPMGLQSTGWLGGWQAAASSRAIAAESAEDLAAGVRFAQQHRLRLVVKGAGHDYLGRNCAPDSLLLWTQPMRGIQVHEAFLPQGAPAGTTAQQAITVQAGVRWLEVYVAATAAGRYVQGGGCTSVGACGGFILGSGFGSFSKRYGSGAAGLLEAEVITADGRIRRVNQHQDPELFFALRGGGACSFGVLSSITLLSHPIPERLALVTGGVKAVDDAAYRELIEAVLRFYPRHLDNPHWGEQIQFNPDNSLGFLLTALDLPDAQVRSSLDALLEPFRAQPDRFTVQPEFTFMPFKDIWNAEAWERLKPGAVIRDDQPGAPKGRFWWEGNQGEVGAFWNSYDSLWIPTQALRERPEQVANAFLDASRHRGFTFQINKGLSGEAAEARQRDRATALHPDCYGAAALVICASLQQYRYPGLAGHEPDIQQGQAEADRVQRVLATLRRVFPKAGTYGNETDYFLKDAGQAQWGPHLERLQAIKRRVDPSNLFRVHNGIGNLQG
ncbi:FAD-binding oxidoreductase [Synechococcus sp. UW69]|uniref:FAD-binding oxidoreductase n=1 Tax=Synechococcus sp. UW69 TaxID=368493 RepID=UPI0010BD3E50|nr:FAD-binding oxidoreductase [Synechococcus sp. UW69]